MEGQSCPPTLRLQRGMERALPVQTLPPGRQVAATEQRFKPAERLRLNRLRTGLCSGSGWRRHCCARPTPRPLGRCSRRPPGWRQSCAGARWHVSQPVPFGQPQDARRDGRRSSGPRSTHGGSEDERVGLRANVIDQMLLDAAHDGSSDRRSPLRPLGLRFMAQRDSAVDLDGRGPNDDPRASHVDRAAGHPDGLRLRTRPAKGGSVFGRR